MHAMIRRGHRALDRAERGAVRFAKFRWWLADRIRPIPVNAVIRDRDEVRRWISESDHVPEADEQKAMDAFARLRENVDMLDTWRRDWDYTLHWDSEGQRFELDPD